ncbi:hypothetical protein IFM89_006497 [Coptis chinensis]|uniref:Zinc finger PMZ-type domain-containing protein n=1 Tax=Coptis chinensis TaxID=261450 RepID=A0A835IHY7_9MAGN|nr:hypothetical protein IFM89_006497 [Coptis chinensis]
MILTLVKLTKRISIGRLELLVVNELEEYVRDHPNSKPVNIYNEIYHRYRVKISYFTAWKSKLGGIPCVHAIAVIRPLRPSRESWSNPYFLAEAFKATYACSIYPFDSEED